MPRWPDEELVYRDAQVLTDRLRGGAEDDPLTREVEDRLRRELHELARELRESWTSVGSPQTSRSRRSAA